MKAQIGIDGGEMVIIEKKKSSKKEKIKNDKSKQSDVEDAWG